MNEREAIEDMTSPATVLHVLRPTPSETHELPDAEELRSLGVSARAATLGRLQRSAGNAAVQRWLAPARSIPPSIQRNVAEDLTETADVGETLAHMDQEQNVNQPPAMRVSNIADVGAARQLVTAIERWRANLLEGASATGAFATSENRVTPAKVAANEEIISVLDDYLVTAGEQSRTLGSFQDGLQKSRTDFARLKAQVTHLVAANRISGDSGQMGAEIIKSAGFEDADAARARMQRLEANPAMLAAHTQMQIAHDDMVTLGQQVGAKQSKISTAAYNYNESLNALKKGVPSVTTNPDQAKEEAELKEKIENVKKYVGKGLELGGKGLEAAGVPGAEKVGEHAGPVVDFLTERFFDAELNGIEAKINMYNTNHKENAITATLNAVRAASSTFIAAITEFNECVEKFAHAQTTFRDQIRAFGRAGDSGHGDKFAQIASVLAEVDTYETQLDDTLRLAYQEQAAGAQASSARQPLDGRDAIGARAAGMSFYEPYKWFHINGGWSYECIRHELHLSAYGMSGGSAEGAAGANATVEQAVKDLQWLRNEVDPMRQALARAMDLRMEGEMPTSAGGPEPTARSANTAL